MRSGNKILLTGASGFLGSAVLTRLPEVALVGRNKPANYPGLFFERDISSSSDFSGCVRAMDVVVHCAARAHIMAEDSLNPLAEYRRVNVGGTLKLAQQASAAGVRRFIFISSIKVNGETTTGQLPYLPEDDPNPQDAYGISKTEAEEGLRKIAQETDMEVVIIRPPLVYGPGVKANFLNLIKLAKTSLPLPFGGVGNKRSMVYIGNLVDFIVKCIDHPNAANQIFLVSDGRDLSLRELLMLLRGAMGKSARLIIVPIFMFKLSGYAFGKKALIDRLIGSLRVDSGKAKELLDWQPPFTVEQGVQVTVDSFMMRNK